MRVSWAFIQFTLPFSVLISPFQGQAGQKDLTDRKIAVGRLVTDQLDVILEEALRYLNVNAGSIAGLAVGIHGAAMPYGLQRLDPLLDHAAARSPSIAAMKPTPQASCSSAISKGSVSVC